MIQQANNNQGGQTAQDQAQQIQNKKIELITKNEIGTLNMVSSQGQENYQINKGQYQQKNDEILKNQQQQQHHSQQQDDVLQNSKQFWLMINHAALNDMINAYNMGVFNTLFDHVDYIYSWNSEEKQLYYALINSLPQGMAAIVSLFAGNWAQQYGRRKMLIILNYICMVGSAITLIQNTYALIIGRLVIGFCFGGWSCIGPLYSIEIACKKYKGISGTTYSLYFGFGILLAFVLGYGLPGTPQESKENSYWRLMLGMPILLAGLINCGYHFFFKNETICYVMLTEKNEKKTQEILKTYYKQETADDEYNDIHQFALGAQGSSKQMGYLDLFNDRYRSRTILIFLFTMAFCYCGANAVNVYCFSIIASIEDASVAQLFTSLSPIGDILGPFASMVLITTLGRKKLYVFGLIACISTLVVFCIFGWADVRPAQKYFLILFKLVFAMSVGPVHWTFPSEVMPPVGIGFFAFSYWVCSLSTIQIYPYLLNGTGTEVSIIVFPIVTIFLILYLAKYMKDTTGKTKDEIEKLYTTNYHGHDELHTHDVMHTHKDLGSPNTVNGGKLEIPTQKQL